MIKIIYESKQVGLLYRTIDIDYLQQTLENDSLYSPPNNIICCTRNKNYYKKKRPLGVTLVLDGDKLSNNYKIVPYMNPGEIKLTCNEFEERIYGPVNNLSRYLIEIIIPKGLKNNELFKIKLDQNGFKTYQKFINFIIDKGIKIVEK